MSITPHLLALALLGGCGGGGLAPSTSALVAEGRQVFRYETFGDEAQWTDVLKMHEVVEQAVSPRDPGAIIALSPALDAPTKAIYNSWGKGKYDPRFNVDGVSKPVVIPPAYGLAGIHKVTFTGDGDSPAYWNRYVAVIQMGGLGSFSEPRLNLHITRGNQDLVSAKLPSLEAYQLSLAAPAAPRGSFDSLAAERGRVLFNGAAQCVTCHSGSVFTDANSKLHAPSASMAEPETPSYASRSATKMYRTTPLRGAWQHAPYFHDGSAPTLDAAVETYDQRLNLRLSAQEIQDLAQYLKSL